MDYIFVCASFEHAEMIDCHGQDENRKLIEYIRLLDFLKTSSPAKLSTVDDIYNGLIMYRIQLSKRSSLYVLMPATC